MTRDEPGGPQDTLWGWKEEQERRRRFLSPILPGEFLHYCGSVKNSLVRPLSGRGCMNASSHGNANTVKIMPSLRIEAFAQQLLDYEAADGNPVPRKGDAALRVCEKLRHSLSTLAGVKGFRSLLERALTLAKEEVPWLNAAEVNEEGVLVGAEPDPQLDKGEVAKGEVILIAHLIDLLVAFVGEALTLNLVRDVWPEARDFEKAGNEEKP